MNRLRFEKELVEVQGFRRITNHFKKDLWNIPQINIEKPEGCQHVTGWTCKH